SIGLAMYAFLYPMLGELKVPVLLYILVILTMVWRSFAQNNQSLASRLAIVGAVLFAMSDSIIAINKFYTPLPYAQELIMLTYWTAQALIFTSAAKYKPE
ncbi:MAG TPA: lysoplasmalogenase, partial [Bacteroidales bacterium]|nr:lysoplasmalogenase [Bacteroidales bacterium]